MRSEIATLIGSFFSFAAWGFYTALFVATLWVNRVQGRSKLSSPFMVTIIFIYIVNLILTGTMTVPVYDIFLNDRAMYFLPYNTLSMLNDLGLILAMLAADALVGWRIYIVWARDIRVLVLAGVLWTGVVVGSLGVLQNDLTVVAEDAKLARQGALDDHDVIDQNAAGYELWLEVQLILSLTFNIIATGMIVGRLWWANQRLKRTSPNDGATGGYTKIILAMVECNALYTAGMVGNILVYFLDSGTAQGFFIYVLPRLVGIAPTLLLLQQSLGYFQPGELTTRMGSRLSRIELGTMQPRGEIKVTISRLESSTGMASDETPEGKAVGWNEDMEYGIPRRSERHDRI